MTTNPSRRRPNRLFQLVKQWKLNLHVNNTKLKAVIKVPPPSHPSNSYLFIVYRNWKLRFFVLTFVFTFYTRNIINKIVWTAAKARKGEREGEWDREREQLLQSARLLAKRAEAPSLSLSLSLSTRHDHELDGGVVFRRIQTDWRTNPHTHI